MTSKNSKAKPEQAKPTMADVAKKVGVSRQLVGMVFSGGAGVGAETADKIRAAAKELGYRPNLAARSLRGDTSNYIGFMFHVDQSSMQGIVAAMYKHTKAAGFNLVITAVSDSHNETEALEELLGHRCEGIVISSSNLSHSRLQKLAREIPMVSLGRRLDNVRAGVVSSKGEAGIFAITQHLIKLGHTDIGYVFGKEMGDAQYRLEGYLAAMEAHKLPTRVIKVSGDFAEAGGGVAAEQFLSENLPTAIVCNNDQAAFGLTHRLLQAGVRIPQDVSVTGYDDTVAKYPFLDLTTIHQDAEELASAVVADLVQRIRGEKYLSETYLTSTELVVRSSTAAPRANPALRID